MKQRTSELEVEGRKLPVSNLDKVLYPAAGFTKGDVINYYIKIAPVLLPHLHGRALTLKRYPEGIGGFFFYEKRCPPHRPKWVRVAPIESKQEGGPISYCLADDLPSLIWMANLADIELHVLLACARAPHRPTMMVFDLDPGTNVDILACAQVALWIRAKLSDAGLECLPKTSGSKGLQLYVPLNTSATFERTKAASRQIAEAVEADHSEAVLTNMRRELRRGKVFIDWSQNSSHKTTVCVYSLRATKTPGVSTPLRWSEVETFLRRGRADAFAFGPDDVLKRVRRNGDLFEPVLKSKQKL